MFSLRAMAFAWGVHLAVLLLSSIAPAHATEVISGRVVAVDDGDTVTLLVSGHDQIRIRLANIDAPEKRHGAARPGQPFSTASGRALGAVVHGRDVRAECVDRDRYGRLICTLFVGQVNVNMQMVRSGMAWANTADPRYLRDARFLGAQLAAQKEKLGLWSRPNAVEPWRWRRVCWEGGQCDGQGK